MTRKRRKLYILIAAVLAGCVLVAVAFINQKFDIPKPRGYFRIDLPQKQYRVYDSSCPLSIEVPVYSQIEIFRDRNSKDSCWFNLFYPKFNARLHCTYMAVDGRIDELVSDAYGFAAKHEMKASALRRTLVDDSTRSVYGIIYDIEGDAASQIQFFLTDSVDHFFRGSLYFFNPPNPDSIAPVLAFLRDDVLHMTQSVHWK